MTPSAPRGRIEACAIWFVVVECDDSFGAIWSEFTTHTETLHCEAVLLGNWRACLWHTPNLATPRILVAMTQTGVRGDWIQCKSGCGRLWVADGQP